MILRAALPLVLGAASFAQAAVTGPILAPGDAQELASVLAEATQVQGICYGWQVTLTDHDNAAASGTDQGSSQGVGTSATTCDRWVVFAADITYTSASSELQDYASFSVSTNLTNGPTRADLADLGISEDGLLSDNEDLEVINAASALPLLVADRGLAPPVELEANTAELPAGDRATGTPGSDWLRKNLAGVVVGGVLVGLAALLALVAALHPGWLTDLKEAAADAD